MYLNLSQFRRFCCHTEIGKLTLSKWDIVNHKGTQGYSVLKYAASKGWFKFSEMSLNKGFDMKRADIYGSVPLHRAAASWILAIVICLLKWNQMKIDFKDVYGSAPLRLACEEDRVQVALLKKCTCWLSSQSSVSDTLNIHIRKLH